MHSAQHANVWSATTRDWLDSIFKIVDYSGGECTLEGKPADGGYWLTRKEAEDAAARVSGGDESGVRFSSFSDGD